MNKKELRKLKRTDLFEIMLAQSEEIDRLRAELATLKKQLEEKAKLENRSVSNYIVTLIQKDLANSSPT